MFLQLVDNIPFLILFYSKFLLVNGSLLMTINGIFPDIFFFQVKFVSRDKKEIFISIHQEHKRQT